jgi:hypothetical protein
MEMAARLVPGGAGAYRHRRRAGHRRARVEAGAELPTERQTPCAHSG